MKYLAFLVFILTTCVIYAESSLKCLVCERVIGNIKSTIKNEDQKKMLEVGSFRIQPDGSQKKTQIKYAGSEIHLHEILGHVCESFNDFAQAKHKETGEITLLNLSTDIDKLSTYELVPDPDLNQSLKYHCESFVEEYDEDIIEALSNTSRNENIDEEQLLCYTKSSYCKSENITEDPDHEEL